MVPVLHVDGLCLVLLDISIYCYSKENRIHEVLYAIIYFKSFQIPLYLVKSLGRDFILLQQQKKLNAVTGAELVLNN